MLIEFSIANFKSFREKQTFSMVAASRLGNKINVFSPDVEGEKLPPLLKIAAIYGPNASGKSNLVLAFKVIGQLAMGLSHGEKPLPVSPFRFDPELQDKPSEFEIHFISERTRYQYTLHLTAARVIYECLIAYPKGKETPLYERVFKNNKEHYSFGYLEGTPEIHNAWKSITSNRQLFIAQAATSSNDELTQLKIPFDWILNRTIVFTELSFSTYSQGTRHYLSKDSQLAANVSNFLNDLDIPISKIKVEYKNEITDDPFSSPEAFDDINKKSKTTLTHTSALGTADFDYSEESRGTRNLLGFWLPWRTISTETTNKDILVVDELDSSLHPQIVESLVRQHLHREKPAQLIFTTHNTHLMSSKLMRRDQFWIVERDKNAATKLYSIYDFSGREGEGLEKRYFEGRYRGLPLLRKH